MTTLKIAKFKGKVSFEGNQSDVTAVSGSNGVHTVCSLPPSVSLIVVHDSVSVI